VKGIPNALTVVRILVTPVLILFLLQETLLGQGTALALFAVGAVSDYLDGKLARQFKARSRLGRFLDPVADKVLVLGTFVALAALHPVLIPWWAVALIAARDFAVTLVRVRAEAQGRSIKTLFMAKTKTTLQIAFLMGLMVLLTMRHTEGAGAVAAHDILEGPVPLIALVVIVAVTVATGLWYFVKSEFVTASST